MIEFTRRIVQALVDDTEKVVVAEVSGGQTTLLKISVGPGEAGKVIGKNGRTIEALRTILSAATAKEGRRVILEIDAIRIGFERAERTTPINKRVSRGHQQSSSQKVAS